jgi:site-specific recombinase XerD
VSALATWNLGAPASAELDWADITQRAPALAATAQRYLAQIGLSLRPGSVKVSDISLRVFCRYLVDHHPATTSFAAVGRPEIEGFKAVLMHPNEHGRPLAANTRRMRVGSVRRFFEHIIEWDWDDAPPRCPVFNSDSPKPDEPLPKALGDPDEPDLLRRVVLELLMRTGMRVGELCGLERDAMVQLGESWWLRIPVGKLHDDRYVPLHPVLVTLLEEWRAGHTNTGLGLLLTNDGRPLNRHVVTRMVNRAARHAGLGHIHPHQLRHTLATQAVNRGMRLEAIAALLGHRSLRMTVRYARIANRTVADEYQAVTSKVEALYEGPPALGAEAEGPAMRSVRAEHRRMLGNGWCTRPEYLDCSFEAICEGCGFFATTVEFKDRLKAQRDHAAGRAQHAREALYGHLVDTLEEVAP